MAHLPFEQSPSVTHFCRNPPKRLPPFSSPSIFLFAGQMDFGPRVRKPSCCGQGSFAHCGCFSCKMEISLLSRLCFSFESSFHLPKLPSLQSSADSCSSRSRSLEVRQRNSLAYNHYSETEPSIKEEET
ncbi:unnamed protein product [Cuscuta epithymum]|uniref:Uncharacterized protein n=1 Tax=Cuscuta epithymum TaxID=186058 RepID=A0AAV0FKU0_9ASTE|nr:unnamed protein product [Cuscuta epithymum]